MWNSDHLLIISYPVYGDGLFHVQDLVLPNRQGQHSVPTIWLLPLLDTAPGRAEKIGLE